MKLDSPIYVAGHRGLAGSAIWRALEREGFTNVFGKSSQELDLRDQQKTKEFFRDTQPKYVFDAAARVGGLQANNTLRADFAYDNLAIQNNLIHACWEFCAEGLMFLSSNCVYPREADQPMKEEALLTGPFEPTNQPYAVAKIAGMELCDAFNRQHGTNFVSVIPASLYGINDTYDSARAHIVPTLIRLCYEAKQSKVPKISIGGSRHRRRELLYSDDFGDACVFLMRRQMDGNGVPSPINLGVGYDLSIPEIAGAVKRVVGYSGDVNYDETKPTGMARKFLDSSRLSSLGWRPKVSLEEGMELAYWDFLKRFSA